MQRLRQRLLEGDAVVAGVLSGTSADGIDVALVRFERSSDGLLGRPTVLAFDVLELEHALARRTRAVLDGAPCDLRASALLSRDLGRAFGSAARALAEREHATIDLVGSHGQTVWHHDGAEPSGAATLQLGDGDFVAEEARATTVSDFRQRDVARGGEGAPLSALADPLIFDQVPRPSAVLNLGGIANLTMLDASPGALAFDTGPAGSLLDGLARRLLDRPFDRDGAAARQGRASERVVGALLEHPFLRREPPKSTGRDTFGERYVDDVIARAREFGVASPADLLASACDFVARSVAEHLDRFAPRGCQWLVIAGGGARNLALLDRLALRCKQPVASASDFGVDPDAREALVFAVLAARCVLGEATTRRRTTGARDGAILGKISRWTESP